MRKLVVLFYRNIKEKEFLTKATFTDIFKQIGCLLNIYKTLGKEKVFSTGNQAVEALEEQQ